MSGVPSWALSDPSTKATAEWTTLWGWIDDVDRVVVDIVQPVRFDDLQALVGEGRRVDRDLGAHAPGRVAQRLLGGDRGQLRRAGVEEGPARGRQDAAGRSRPAASPTRHCQIARVLRIDRPQPGQRARQRVVRVAARPVRAACARASGITRWPPATSGLLVGRRDDLARGERGEHRPQAHDAAGADDDEVHVVARRQLLERVGPADPDRARRQLDAGRGGLVGDADARPAGGARPVRRAASAARPVASATTRNASGWRRARRRPGARSTRWSRGGRPRAAARARRRR